MMAGGEIRFGGRRGYRLGEQSFDCDGEVGTGRILIGFKAANGMAGAIEQELGVIPMEIPSGGCSRGVGQEVHEGDGMDTGKQSRSRDGKAEVLLGVPCCNGGWITQLLMAEVR